MDMQQTIMAKSLLLTGERRCEWIVEALPELGPNDILLQTRTSAISIGSELPAYRGEARTGPEHYPRMTGYENVAIVLACGAEVHSLQPGERVVAFYGHRTHVVLAANKVIPVPADIADPLAILTILSCDAAKGVRKVASLPEEPVLITGAGTMGLLTLFTLKAYGCTTVDVVEPRHERHALAYRLGANRVWSPHEHLPRKYAIGFECSSRNDAFALLQEHLQHNGRLCVTADGNLEPLVLMPAFHEKELHIMGSSDGWDYHKHAAWYFHYIRQQPTALEQIFELEITYQQLIETFEQLASGALRPLKVLVRYE